ncbi:MAG: radical SAM protein [Elusimicrobia bacterium]|nr:radical SAM protein [Elusimicrobiota bacterium]
MSIFVSNLELLVKKYPPINKNLAKERIKNIKWLVNKKAKVCEVTVNSICNNRCLFCYNGEEDFGRFPDADFKTICRALYEGRKQGCWIAAVIGGEPTLNNDIGKIAAFARKIGYDCVKICTNGLKLSDKSYARHLVESGFNMFDISIHGHNAKVHDKLVNSKGAFSKVMKAAENVKAFSMELGTNQVVNRLNYKNFPEFFKMAYRDLGINYYNIIYSHYRGIMWKNKLALKLPVTKAAIKIKEGLKIIKDLKMPVFSRMLVNFPPCVFPEYLNIIADWESEEKGGDPLLLPGGETVNMSMMKNEQALKLASCEKCVLSGKCRGVDREYPELFGEKEFKPIKSENLENYFETMF